MGIFYSIGAALFFSLSHISVRRGVTKLGVQTGTAIMLLAGSITTILIAILFDDIEVLFSANLRGILFFAIAGVIHFIGGWGFMNASSSRIGATRVSAMTSITPLFAAFLAFLTLNQTLNWYLFLGIFLIVIGVYAITTSKE
jgi:drug/metabolite transporter (DMT)-like permease